MTPGEFCQISLVFIRQDSYNEEQGKGWQNDLRRNHSGSKAKIAEMPGLSGLQQQPARGNPGLRGKGSGSTFIRNVEKLKSVRIQMDVLVENKEIDTTSTLFGHTVSLPVYCARGGGN